MAALQDRRRRPTYLPPELEDQDISPGAYRVYCRLCFLASCHDAVFPSYQTLGDKCFGKGLSPDRRRQLAIESVKELASKGMVGKQAQVREDGGASSNLYWLTDASEWGPPSVPGTPPPVCQAHPISSSSGSSSLEIDQETTTTTTTTKSNTPTRVIDAWGSVVGRTPYPGEVLELGMMADEHGEARVLDGIRTTVRAGKTELRYLAGVLRKQAADSRTLKPDPESLNTYGRRAPVDKSKVLVDPGRLLDV